MTIEEITKPGLVDLSFDDANTPPPSGRPERPYRRFQQFLRALYLPAQFFICHTAHPISA